MAPFVVATAGSLAWVALTVADLEMTRTVVLLSLAVVTVHGVRGFGPVLPGDVRVYLELRSATPDAAVTSRLGMRDARLAAVQGLFQLVLVFMRSRCAGAASERPEQ